MILKNIYYFLKTFIVSLIIITLITYIDFFIIENKGSSVFLFIILIVWIASISIWRKLSKETEKKVNLYIIMVVTFYLCSIYGNFLIDFFLDFKLNQFDLDKDGFFSNLEETDEQRKYMSLVINDTARNLYFISGIGLSLIISSLLYFFTYVYLYFRNK